MLSDNDILYALDEIQMNDESDEEFIADFDETEEPPVSNTENFQMNVEPDEEFIADFDTTEEPSVSNTASSNNAQTAETLDATRKQARHQALHTPNFRWKCRGEFQPNIFSFDRTEAGVQKEEFELDENSSILLFFEALVTPNLVGKIVFETNRYYEQTVKREPPSTHSRLQKWVNTNIDEMYTFLAVTMLMPHNNRLKITDCWSTDVLLSSPIYSSTMSRDRYLQLLRLIHFCNNEIQIPGDRLFKIDMVLTDIKKNFRDAMKPFENLAIDESLLPWKGRLSFKQYIKSKRHRFGVKLFIICDVETDYILDFIIYTGATTKLRPYDANIGISGGVVKTLMKNYLDQGHTLFTDNWYTSPILATYLRKHKTNTVGTVRKNRRGMPALQKKLKIGETQSCHTKNMLAMKWMDRREVFMLSTLYKDHFVDIGKTDRNLVTVKKPECVVKYNNNMGSIDKTDMLLSSVECIRKTTKWYKKLFFHIIDLSVLNAYSLYKTTTGKHIPLADFQLELVRQLIQKYCKRTSLTPKKGRSSSKDKPQRIGAPHYPSECMPTPTGQRGRKRCVVCNSQKKQRTSYYQCTECGEVGLCVAPCFSVYHTKINY